MEDELRRLREENQALRQQLAERDQRISLLEQKIDLLIRKIYGASSEKIDPGQMDLLLGMGEPGVPGKGEASAANAKELLAEAESDKRKSRRERKMRLPENLPVIEQIIEPAPVQACPQAYRRIGEEVSELLDFEPGRFVRRRIIRPKYVKRSGEEPPIIAQLPARLIEGGIVAPGLLAHIVVSKFCDHLPLYRQEQIFEQRYEVYLPRQTLCRWMEAAAYWCKPVYEQIAIEIFALGYVKADETPIKYLEPGSGKAQLGYLWTYHGFNGDTLYDWHTGRGHGCLEARIPVEFAGVLQCDGYGAYQTYANKHEDITLAGCWAHARRKFFDALDQSPTWAAWILRQIQLLYRIEKRLRQAHAGPALREAVRQSESRMIVERVQRALLLIKAKRQCLPESLIGKAIDYTLGQWKPLQVFLRDGRVEIDNNLVENAIRPTKLGEKNWLFIGADFAGWRAAVLYTLVTSCRHHGVEPFEYFRYLFENLPRMFNRQIVHVTPRAYAEARRAEDRLAS